MSTEKTTFAVTGVDKGAPVLSTNSNSTVYDWPWVTGIVMSVVSNLSTAVAPFML